MTGRRAQVTQQSVGRFAWVIFPVVAIVLAAIGWVGRVDPPDRGPGPVPVDVAAYTCPLVGGVRLSTGQVTAGTSAVATLYPGGAESSVDPRTWHATAPRGDALSVEQRGYKSGAVGFIRGQLPGAFGGGLVVGGCPGVADESWFLGLGSGSGHESTLVLTNTGGSPAVADVNLWASDGPVPAIGNKGLVVPPHSTKVLPLHSIAAGELELGVQVVRRRGALTASALDTLRTSRNGTESLMGTSSAKQLWLSAVPGGSDSRNILLLNPGEESTRAKVEVFADGKPFTPAGLDNISLPAGKFVWVGLPAQRQPVSVRVTASREIVGSVRVAQAHSDFGYAMPVRPLEHVAIAPMVTGVFPSVVVTSTGRRATLRVTTFDSSMRRLVQVTDEVAAGSTKALDLKKLQQGKPAYIQLESSEPVVAAALYASGKLLAILPLADAPLVRPGPDVVPAD